MATAIYVRISSDPSGERAGVERQRSDCEALAGSLGLNGLKLYEDNDKSAFSGKARPAFERMLTDAADGHVSTVIVWAVDRLYRRLADLERIVTVFDAAGVTVHAVKSGDIDLSTADGRLHARLLGSVAQHESEKKSERIAARAKQRALVERRMTTAQRPFGWRFIEGKKGGLVPDPVEAPALAAAYQDIADGLSLRATWKRLGQRVDVGKMAPATLGLILRNPRNAGLVVYKDEIVGEAADGQKIVDRDLFDRAAAILNDPARRTSPGRPANTWLTGLLVCGRCGGPMAAGGRLDTGPAYICSRHQHLRRRRHLLDQPVLAVAGDLLATLGARGLLAQSLDTDDSENHARRLRIADSEARLDALAAMLADGTLTPADYQRAVTKIRAAMNADQEALVAHAGRPALASLASSEDVSATWRQWIADDDREPVRSVLSELIDRVIVNPDRNLHIEWAIGADSNSPAMQPTVIPPVEPRVEGREQRRSQVADLNRQGLNVSAISTALGCDRATVRNDLKALGLYDRTAS